MTRNALNFLLRYRIRASWCLAGLLAAAVLLQPTPSRAQCDSEISVTAVVGVMFSSPSLIAVIGNAARLAQEKHAPAWGTLGIVSGSIGLLMQGLMAIPLGLGSRSCRNQFSTAVNLGFLSLNAMALALGIANIALLAKRRHTGVLKRYRRYRRYRRYGSLLPPSPALRYFGLPLPSRVVLLTTP